jgi:arabinan endo-1,5-alpha-L-arabinosidase
LAVHAAAQTMPLSSIKLSSAPGAPFRFEITVAGTSADAQERCFSISGTPASGDAPLTREYALRDTSHEAYLDLYAAIARDFGICMPRNRREPEAPPSETRYTALLTHNLSAGILYGYGDPAVLRVPDVPGSACAFTYYLVVTSNDAPDSFPILHSRDLVQWEPAGFVFPAGNKPRWAADGEGVSDYWAPELHCVQGEFRVYFCARMKHSGELAIGLARSPSPLGPFVPDEQPLIAGGVIDPHLLVDAQGMDYLFWKQDTNDRWPGLLSDLLCRHGELTAALFPDTERQRTASLCQALWPWVQTLHPMERFLALQPLIEAAVSDFSTFRNRLTGLAQQLAEHKTLESIGRDVLDAMRTPIFGQQLAPDGVTFVGERAVVLMNDRPWEAHLVEGIWVAREGPKFYLFYAGNDFSTADYGIGVAVADAPLGPYVKIDAPLLRSTAQWSGPGHPSVADGLDGRPQLFLHGFFPGHTGYKAFRALLTIPIAFNAGQVVLRSR